MSEVINQEPAAAEPTPVAAPVEPAEPVDAAPDPAGSVGAAAPDSADAARPDPAGPTRPPAVGASGGWWDSLRYGTSLWLSGLMAYVLVTAVSWLPFDHVRSAPATLREALDNWHRWDTTWYVIIADGGYHADSRSAAFFPLYPILVNGFNRVLPSDTFQTALIVSILACLATLVLVHRLAADLFDRGTARRTAFYLLAFPTGFFLMAAYNESLFIALSVASLYCMRRRHWWLAGALAGLASGARLAGVLLGLAFAYEYLRQRGFSVRRIRADVLAIVLVPAGLIGYALYCWQSFGDPLYFQKVQSVWFRTGFNPPWTTMIDTTRMIIHGRPLLGPTEIRNIINLGTAIAVIVLLCLALVGRWRLGAPVAYLVLFAGADILMPLLSPIHSDYPMSSMWRFALECVVVFMVLARMGRDQRFDRYYLIAALPVQGVMVLTFVQNQFVA